MKTLYKWTWCLAGICLSGAAHLSAGADPHLGAGGGRQASSSDSQSQKQQGHGPLEAASPISEARSSVSLAPAVVMVKCKFGQSYTQAITLFNGTQEDITSELVAEDVVVRSGTRGFVLAGETPGSIAATAVFSQKRVVVKPGQSVSVGVTFTLTPETQLRAAVALFRGISRVASSGSVAMTASLGALFTFTVSEDFQIEGTPLTVSAQSTTANLDIAQMLTNTGSEPVIAHGIAAVLNNEGLLVGKTPFEEQRLLPGERLLFRAAYPTELKTGSYHVFASFQYAEKVFTSLADFTVP